MQESITKGQCGQRELLAKAAALCGGLKNLAYVLDTRAEDLWRWIAGAEPVPDAVMREALVAVSSIRNVAEPDPGPTHDRAQGLLQAP